MHYMCVCVGWKENEGSYCSQKLRGVSNYLTVRKLTGIQIVHLSLHSRENGCNEGIESP